MFDSTIWQLKAYTSTAESGRTKHDGKPDLGTYLIGHVELSAAPLVVQRGGERLGASTTGRVPLHSTSGQACASTAKASERI